MMVSNHQAFNSLLLLLDRTWLRKVAVKEMPNLVGMMARPRLVHRFCLPEEKKKFTAVV